jgi:hypothetical protein
LLSWNDVCQLVAAYCYMMDSSKEKYCCTGNHALHTGAASIFC